MRALEVTLPILVLLVGLEIKTGLSITSNLVPLQTLTAIGSLFEYHYTGDYLVYSDGKDIYQTSPLSINPITSTIKFTTTSDPKIITFPIAANNNDLIDVILACDTSGNVYHYDLSSSKHRTIATGRTIIYMDGWYTATQYLLALIEPDSNCIFYAIKVNEHDLSITNAYGYLNLNILYPYNRLMDLNKKTLVYQRLDSNFI